MKSIKTKPEGNPREDAKLQPRATKSNGNSLHRPLLLSGNASYCNRNSWIDLARSALDAFRLQEAIDQRIPLRI